MSGFSWPNSIVVVEEESAMMDQESQAELKLQLTPFMPLLLSCLHENSQPQVSRQVFHFLSWLAPLLSNSSKSLSEDWADSFLVHCLQKGACYSSHPVLSSAVCCLLYTIWGRRLSVWSNSASSFVVSFLKDSSKHEAARALAFDLVSSFVLQRGDSSPSWLSAKLLHVFPSTLQDSNEARSSRLTCILPLSIKMHFQLVRFKSRCTFVIWQSVFPFYACQVIESLHSRFRNEIQKVLPKADGASLQSTPKSAKFNAISVSVRLCLLFGLGHKFLCRKILQND